MKLISCHIENFGRLHNQTLRFDRPVTLICEENGWGKSTLAAFIRVMFYGFEGERKRSLENERQRYAPWQGGVFGGQLTFQVGERCYTVTRIFGAKTALDKFELRDADTNLLSSDYSERIGEELFQIDRASFMRTVFIGQDDCATQTTDAIDVRIGKLSDDTDDKNNYEAAAQRLKDWLNAASPRRATGELSRRKNELTQLEQSVRAGVSLEHSIAEQDKLLTRGEAQKAFLEKRRTELQGAQDEAARQKSRQAEREAYARICTQLSRRKEQMSQARRQLPEELPSEAELDALLEKWAKRQRKYSALETKKQLLESYRSSEEAAKNRAIEAKEARREAEQLQRAQEERLRRQQEELRRQREELNRQQEEARRAASRSGKQLILLLVGLFFIAAGAVQSLRGNGIQLLPLLLGIAITAAWVGLRVTGRSFADMRKGADEENEADESYADETSESEQTPGAEASEHQLSDRSAEEAAAAEQEQWSRKRQELLAEMREDAERIKRTDAELAAYLGIESVSAAVDMQALLMRQREALLRYSDVVREYQASQKEREAFEQAHDMEILQDSQYGEQPRERDTFAPKLDGEALEDTASGDQLREQEQLEQKYDLEAIQTELQRVRGELSRVTEENASVRRMRRELAEQYDAWSEQQELLEQRREEYGRLQKKYRLVSKTQDYLSRAKEALNMRYVGPVYESFREYYAYLTEGAEKEEGIAADAFRMDANVRLTALECGKQRETEQLSAGYQDLVGFCLRIALADAMYQKERPMLVMDDPFLNLDEGKCRMAMRLLEHLGKRYQILYFTCHPSRANENAGNSGRDLRDPARDSD